MGKGSLQVFAVVPGAANLRPLLSNFSERGGGIVTTLSDARLVACRTLVADLEEIELAPFAEVVARSMAIAGGEPRTIAQSGHVLAAVEDTCRELGELSPFYSSRHFAGFHRALVSTIDELRHWGIDAEALERLVDLEDGRLAAKIQSLATIDREVERTLADLGRCRGDGPLRQSLTLTPPPGSDLGRLFVIASRDATPADLDWIRWAASAGASVTVVEDRHPTSAAFFHAFGSDLGVEAKLVGDANPLLSNLFQPSILPLDASLQVRLTSTADPLAEAEWAVRGCLEQLQKGDETSTMAIYARDLTTYGPIVEVAAARLGLRVKVSQRIALLTNRFARWIADLLLAITCDDVRRLIPVLASGYVGSSRNLRTQVADAIKSAWRDGPSAWDAVSDWSRSVEPPLLWLSELLSWREEGARSPTTIGAWSQRFGLLMDQLVTSCAGLAMGSPQQARDQRALASMNRALAQRASILRVREDREIALTEFVAVAVAAWDAAETSVPTSESGVSVVSTADELGPLKSLFAIGMLEGQFPRRRSEDPILTDEERAEISRRIGLKMPLRDSHFAAAGEREEFFRMCAAPSALIALSYPQTDEERDNVPAFYLDEVARAVCGQVERVDRPRPVLAPPIEECLSKADADLRSSIDAPREDPPETRFEARQAPDSFEWPPERAFTPRELRDAAQCPFQFFARRRLEIKPTRGSWRIFELLRIPVDCGLAEQPDAASATQAMNHRLSEMLGALAADAQPWDVAMLRSAGRRLIDQWVEREFAAREIWYAGGRTVHSNARFGTAGLKSQLSNELPIEGRVSGVFDSPPFTIVSLNEASIKVDEGAPEGASRMGELDKLYLGLHFTQIENAARALDIETMGAQRILLVQNFGVGRRIPSDQLRGLRAVEAFPGDDWKDAARRFVQEVKVAAAASAKRIRAVEVEPTPGDHCSSCDFGELCRRSQDFGESASPFGDE